MKRSVLIFVFLIQCITIEMRGDSVVGIHGFLTQSRSMRAIRGALEYCGYDVYLWDYPSRRKCLEEHACDLIPYLQQVACMCPGRPINFVTHSSGALILRRALNLPGCPEEAKMGRAVLLAPPNQGSRLARRFSDFTPLKFAMGDRSGWELMNLGPCKMSCFGDFPESMQVLVIAGTKGNQLFRSPNDGFIAIDETRLNTPFYFRSFPLSHGDLLTCRPVLCCMCTFLSTEMPESEEWDSGCESGTTDDYCDCCYSAT